MTKINRAQLEKTIVADIFLPFLRKYLKDPNSTSIQPSRPNDTWIRSSFPVRVGNETPEVIDYGRKRNIIKEASKPQYPYVIVQNFQETNERKTIEVMERPYRNVSCELAIRILDVGDVTRVSNLAGQISRLLETYEKKELRPKGLSNIDWNVVSTADYRIDDSEMREKQVLLFFDARVDEWQM